LRKFILRQGKLNHESTVKKGGGEMGGGDAVKVKIRKE
jgi:hypothetical protein